MLPAEVLENILLFLARRRLDKLVCLSSSLSSVLLDDSFAAKSPLRRVTRLMLYSLHEAIIIVASTGGAKEFRSFPSDDVRGLIHLCFFRDITVNASDPELVQWVCTHRAILHGDKLIVPTPLTSFELFNVRLFRHVALDSDPRCSRDEWRSHRGDRRLVSLQCDLLRDCEKLTGGHFHAVSDFAFDVRDVAEWLHRPSEKGRELTLDVKLLDGEPMSLIEMLEESAIGSATPFPYVLKLSPLEQLPVDRIQQMRSRRFNRTTGEYFDISIGSALLGPVMKLFVLLLLVASTIPSVHSLIGANEFEDWLATTETHPCSGAEQWIQAYTQIPQATRRCLMGRLTNLFGMFWNSQPINIQQHLAQTKAQCSSGFDKVQALLNIVVGDMNKQTRLVQQIFGQGFRKASVNYQTNWLKAHPNDQQTMASIFPKLNFFFNGPYADSLTKQALAVSECRYSQIPAFLVTVGWIHQLAAKTNPPPLQGPYAALHQAVKEDFTALRAYAATNFPGAEQILKNSFNSNTL
ncbi:hypothetical protein AAVH_26287 [Aphelenchoides avenae]|nr:hypothetical protein AAVH_26287 [Aphelenchus avenae]